jgi:hypothetical protein
MLKRERQGRRGAHIVIRLASKQTISFVGVGAAFAPAQVDERPQAPQT